MYAKNRPAKRKRATLGSDPPRDNRMGCDGCPSGRGANHSPPPNQEDSLSFPPCLVNPLSPAPKRTFSLSN